MATSDSMRLKMVCPTCEGTGIFHGAGCSTCSGTGAIDDPKKTQIGRAARAVSLTWILFAFILGLLIGGAIGAIAVIALRPSSDCPPPPPPGAPALQGPCGGSGVTFDRPIGALPHSFVIQIDKIRA